MLIAFSLVSSCLPDSLMASCSPPPDEPGLIWEWGKSSVAVTDRQIIAAWIIKLGLYALCVWFPVRRRLRLVKERVRFEGPG